MNFPERLLLGAHRTALPKRFGKRDKVERWVNEDLLLSVVSQDSFQMSGNADRTENLDHDAALKVVHRECQDPEVHCVIFEGFRAFHDA